ncbi:MAG: adenylate kinase family protein [Candidatus Thermoplasmatota archaeon]|nr:adenylate kinase family protein [Candidatus Thermoplasmatota archaeon]
MDCALTGTPGVGKTTVSNLLREEGYEVLDLNRFIKENDLSEGEDPKRDSLEVDIGKLKEVYEKKKKDLNVKIVEGHLSHHLSLSPTIVLRCSPAELKKRMEKKGWDEEKIEENLEAEALDGILIEALDVCEEVYEIDTTEKDPEEVTECVKEILNGETEMYEPGEIDWTEEYFSGR